MKIRMLNILPFLLLSVACGLNEDKKETDAHNPEPAVEKEYVRPASAGSTSGAYFIYVNGKNVVDTLRSVSSPVADMAEIHRMVMGEGDMMKMEPVTDLILQPGDSAVFKPGGMHIMLMQLKQDINTGDSVKITLDLAQSGLQEFHLPVQLN